MPDQSRSTATRVSVQANGDPGVIRGGSTDRVQKTPWTETFKEELRQATLSGHVYVLDTLLDSADDLPKEHLEFVSECIELGLFRSRIGCCRRLFEYLAVQLSAEELLDTAREYLEQAINSGKVSHLDLVLEFAGPPSQGSSLRLLWYAAIELRDKSTALLGYLLDNYQFVWSGYERRYYLGEALCDAAETGCNKLGAFLLERGVNPDYKSPDACGKPPASFAAPQSLKQLVNKLIGYKVDGGRTRNLTTVALQHPSVLQALAEACAEIDVTFDGGFPTEWMPLLAAIHDDKVESVRMLLEYGCNVNLLAGRNTPLSHAVARGLPDIIRVLLRAGANPNLHSADQLKFPLLHTCVNKASPGILKLLLRYGISVDAPDADGNQPLHCISDKTTPEIIRLLVKYGAEVNAVGGRSSDTPLYKAVSAGNLEVVKYLIEIGADVNHTGHNGITALHKSCSMDGPVAQDIVNFLLQEGADVNAVSTGIYGTPFQATLRWGNRGPEVTDSIVRTLMNHKDFNFHIGSPWWGANINAACLFMGLGVVDEFLQAGVQVNSEDGEGRQLVHFATYRSLLFVRYLVRKGASLDATDAMGRTLLHTSVLAGHLDVVRYILRKRRNLVNVRDANGWTPLLWAVSECNAWSPEATAETRAAIVKELLGWGANPILEGSGHDRFWTAYSLAAYHGRDKLIQDLLWPRDGPLQALDQSERDRWDHRQMWEQQEAYLWANSFCDFCFGVSTYPIPPWSGGGRQLLLVGVMLHLRRGLSQHAEAGMPETELTTNRPQTLRGFFYYCDHCYTGFSLCFRCYRARDSIFPEHDFRQRGKHEYTEEYGKEYEERRKEEYEEESCSEYESASLPDSEA